jgi:VanZ family protein
MIRYFQAPLLWAITILIFSIVPTSELPDFSYWRIISFDKFAHVCMYALLSFLVMKSCLKQYSSKYIRYNAYRFTAITTSLYGILIELIQALLITDRYGDWVDVLANTIGVIAGVLIFRFIFFDYIR